MATQQDNYTTGDDNIAGCHDVLTPGQTFTAINDYALASLKVKIYRAEGTDSGLGGLPGTLEIAIKAVDGGGKPTGTDLATGNTNGDIVTIDRGGEWVEVTMSPLNIISGNKYAIILRAASGDVDNQIKYRRDASSPTYAGGTAVNSGDNGANWTVISGSDFMFEVFSIEEVVEVETITSLSRNLNRDYGIHINNPTPSQPVAPVASAILYESEQLTIINLSEDTSVRGTIFVVDVNGNFIVDTSGNFLIVSEGGGQNLFQAIEFANSVKLRTDVTISIRINSEFNDLIELRAGTYEFTGEKLGQQISDIFVTNGSGGDATIDVEIS